MSSGPTESTMNSNRGPINEFRPRSQNSSHPRPHSRPTTTPCPPPGSFHKKLTGLDPSCEEIDSVVVQDLHWWTRDYDLVLLARDLGFEVETKDVHFLDHKVNGKSKGQAVINCYSKDNAMKLHDYLQINMFQGKKIPSALAATAFGNPLHPGNQEFPTARPLSTAIHSSVRQPTNAHGGVNFNRVRPNSRTVIQANLGVGHPNGRNFTMGNFNPVPVPPTTTGEMVPIDPAIAWSSHQEGFIPAPYGYVPMNQPLEYNGQEFMMGMMPPVTH
ncbi:uncharacterized protein L201_004907 [Kwoniella dendrophila CBS 6074]|uniref:Uncharacterized protein n=1 Tax=Kwoniella dendrophila CBS 6074 TaxID=1295534 RepID=A0AAX4JYM5_9TREE